MSAPRILYLKGMHGMGDNFHERAFIRRYMQEWDQVWLETSWPSIFWDLADKGLKVVFKESALRTQGKNAERERDAFYWGNVPQHYQRTDKQIWYRAKDIREKGSVLGAMAECLGTTVGDGDFRFPLKDSWVRQYFYDLLPQFNTEGKPILVYRPLVERTEWSGCSARNPDRYTYGTLYKSIRERFYVVSVADIQPGKEWIVDQHGIKADREYHHGELPVEMLTTLVKHAAMVFTAPGFPVVMSQSQGTPVCVTFGGYENSKSFSVGAKWAPYLGIDPINSCQCFMHVHACDKTIDIPEALAKLGRFTDEAISSYQARRRAEAPFYPEATA